MEKIDIRIQSIQIELQDTGKEFENGTNSYNNHVFLNLSEGISGANHSPEEVIAQNGEWIRKFMYNLLNGICDSKHSFRLGLSVYVFDGPDNNCRRFHLTCTVNAMAIEVTNEKILFVLRCLEKKLIREHK